MATVLDCSAGLVFYGGLRIVLFKPAGTNRLDLAKQPGSTSSLVTDFPVQGADRYRCTRVPEFDYSTSQTRLAPPTLHLYSRVCMASMALLLRTSGAAARP